MKRDLDFIRDILLAIENDTSGCMAIENFANDEYPPAIVSYHLTLLLDADFIEASAINTIGCPYTQFIVNRMTSNGHDYLDSIRSNNVWNKTKDALVEVGGSSALETVKTIATSIALKLLGV